MKRTCKICFERILIPLFFFLLVPIQINAESYRVETLKLISPHFFYDPLFFDCSDVTNDAPSIARSVNEQLQRSLSADKDRDFFTDFSILIRTRDGETTLSQTSCKILDPISCIHDPADDFIFSSEEKSTACFDPETLNNTDIEPKASRVDGPCTATDAQDLSFDVVGSSLSFTDGRLFFRESGKSISGTLRAFVSEEVAAETEISGDPLSLYLRGSASVCEPGDDRAMNEAGERGWWFVFEFTAQPTEVFVSGEGCGCETSPSSFSFMVLFTFLGLISIRRKRRLI